jgi:hypothetical protein
MKLSVKTGHEKLGHINEDAVRAMAEVARLGVNLRTRRCLCCLLGGQSKAEECFHVQRAYCCVRGRRRIFLDISTLKYPVGFYVTKSNWRVTQLKFSDFFDTKSGMVEPTCCTSGLPAERSSSTFDATTQVETTCRKC